MRDKAAEALKLYEETEPWIKDAVKKVGLSWGSFRRALSANPDLLAEYHAIQESRAELYAEKAIEVGTDENKDPRHARVASDTYRNAAQLYNRRRFGERVAVDVAVVDLTSALADAAARARLQPPCDLATVIDVESEPVAALPALRATDKQSDEALPADHSGFFDE